MCINHNFVWSRAIFLIVISRKKISRINHGGLLHEVNNIFHYMKSLFLKPRKQNNKRQQIMYVILFWSHGLCKARKLYLNHEYSNNEVTLFTYRVGILCAKCLSIDSTRSFSLLYLYFFTFILSLQLATLWALKKTISVSKEIFFIILKFCDLKIVMYFLVHSMWVKILRCWVIKNIFQQHTVVCKLTDNKISMLVS